MAEKGGRHTKSGESASGVEWTAPRSGALRSVAVVDHVDQRFAAYDDHGAPPRPSPPGGDGRISPEPRVIIRVRTVWTCDGERSPSRRRKSTAAAVRPISPGSW